MGIITSDAIKITFLILFLRVLSSQTEKVIIEQYKSGGDRKNNFKITYIVDMEN